MSDMATEQPQGQEPPVSENAGGEDTGQQSQAPYAEYLDRFPTSLRPLAEDTFREWDANTSRRFQQVHSEYEPLKPYKAFVEQGVDPQTLTQAYEVLNRLRDDPRTVFDTIGKTYGFFDEQGQQDDQTGSEDIDPETVDPRLAGVEEMTRTMAEFLVAQEQEKAQQEADKQVETELNELRSKFGDFDEKFVLTQMLNGATGEQAVQMFNQIVENAVKARKAPAAPQILSSGGGVVSESVDVSKMTPAERKAYVRERLAQTHQE